MQIVKLRKVGDSSVVILPPGMVEALHLQENDDMAVEVMGNRIIITRATDDFQDAWDAYKEIEPRYRNASRKLAE